MVNSACIPSSRRVIHRRHAPSIQALQSLMELLGKEIHKSTLIPTRINIVRIWLVMGYGVSSPYQNLTINRRSGTFFFISLDFPWTTWNATSKSFRNILRRISICFRTCRGHDCTCGALSNIIFFRKYWHWCCWYQPYLRSMLPLWIHLSPITMVIWKRLLPIWRWSNSRVI